VKKLDKEVSKSSSQSPITLTSMELLNLTHAFRQSGSAGVSSSSAQLRTRLAKVLFLFNLNAAALFFPTVRVEYPPDTIPAWGLESDCFPEELEHLAEDMTTFLKYMHEFPDLTYEVSIGDSTLRLFKLKPHENSHS
jgi:hypothetical protein